MRYKAERHGKFEVIDVNMNPDDVVEITQFNGRQGDGERRALLKVINGQLSNGRPQRFDLTGYDVGVAVKTRNGKIKQQHNANIINAEAGTVELVLPAAFYQTDGDTKAAFIEIFKDGKRHPSTIEIVFNVKEDTVYGVQAEDADYINRVEELLKEIDRLAKENEAKNAVRIKELHALLNKLSGEAGHNEAIITEIGKRAENLLDEIKSNSFARLDQPNEFLKLIKGVFTNQHIDHWDSSVVKDMNDITTWSAIPMQSTSVIYVDGAKLKNAPIGIGDKFVIKTQRAFADTWYQEVSEIANFGTKIFARTFFGRGAGGLRAYNWNRKDGFGSRPLPAGKLIDTILKTPHASAGVWMGHGAKIPDLPTDDWVHILVMPNDIASKVCTLIVTRTTGSVRPMFGCVNGRGELVFNEGKLASIQLSPAVMPFSQAVGAPTVDASDGTVNVTGELTPIRPIGIGKRVLLADDLPFSVKTPQRSVQAADGGYYTLLFVDNKMYAERSDKGILPGTAMSLNATVAVEIKEVADESISDVQ